MRAVALTPADKATPPSVNRKAWPESHAASMETWTVKPTSVKEWAGRSSRPAGFIPVLTMPSTAIAEGSRLDVMRRSPTASAVVRGRSSRPSSDVDEERLTPDEVRAQRLPRSPFRRRHAATSSTGPMSMPMSVPLTTWNHTR